MIKKLLIVGGCLAVYSLLAFLAAGLVLFIGCGIYAAWDAFIKLLA